MSQHVGLARGLVLGGLHCLTGFNLRSLAFPSLGSTANTVTSAVNKKIVLAQPSVRTQTLQCHQHFSALVSLIAPRRDRGNKMNEMSSLLLALYKLHITRVRR